MRVMAQARSVSPSRRGRHAFHTRQRPPTAVDAESALRPALGAQAAWREQGGDPFCSRSLASSGGDNTVATSLGAGHHGFGCDL